MKKSTKKTVNYLKRYIGLEIIRTKPTAAIGDWSYTNEALLLLGFTQKGEMIVERKYFGKGILPEEFTDRCWKTKKSALKAKRNRLNQWRGKKIKRTSPTKIFIGYDNFATKEPMILLSASKWHILVKDEEGRTHLLNSRYNKPDEWILAE